jgi:dCMP deaminase
MNEIQGYIEEKDRPDANKWDKYFLEMCMHVSKMSKDPSTKCGCVIMRPDKTVVSVGYNGFPKSMRDDPELYANREVKYDRVVHCEMNALIHARTDISSCVCYTTPGLSCSRCCVHLIQAGIYRFVGPFPTGGYLERWGELVKRTREYIIEAGCSYTEIDIENWKVVTDNSNLYTNILA